MMCQAHINLHNLTLSTDYSGCTIEIRFYSAHNLFRYLAVDAIKVLTLVNSKTTTNYGLRSSRFYRF
jgi:hypothetical protein